MPTGTADIEDWDHPPVRFLALFLWPIDGMRLWVAVKFDPLKHDSVTPRPVVPRKANNE